MCVSDNEEAIIDQLGEDQFDCVKVLRTKNRLHYSLMDRKGHIWTPPKKLSSKSCWLRIPSSHALIWNLYKLSKSLYYQITNDQSEWDMTGNFEINQAQKEWLSDKARLLLSNLVNPPKPPITIDQLRLKLAELNKESVSKYQIRKWLQKHQKYTYK